MDSNNLINFNVNGMHSKDKRNRIIEFNVFYFLGLEKQRQVKKSISKLKDDKHCVITDQSNLLHIIKEYYEKLYTTTKPDKDLLENYIFETNLERNINVEEFKICDGKLTIEECTSAINMMKLNKSPGLDGLTVEFYQTFWDKIKFFLVDVLNKSQDEKLLTYSQRTSVLSLIFKKDDPLLLENYRPISLLNVDLKLLSYVLSQRLKKILPKIINEDQTGYLQNRFMGFNHRQIQDIIDYADSYKIDGAIIFVDFIKAFDTLEWDFMLNTLKHFGFNDSFIRWVQTLYSDIQTCVSNNGWVSEIFKNSRGIRQGCPLSALLFILSVEIMALRL